MYSTWAELIWGGGVKNYFGSLYVFVDTFGGQFGYFYEFHV